MELFKSMETNSETKKPKGVYAFGGLGGVGKTTLLVNIAEAIKEHSQYEPSVCILDLNIWSPTVLYKFHNCDLIESKHDLLDWFSYIEENNEIETYPLKNIITIHEPSGIDIINVKTLEITKIPKDLTLQKIQPIIDCLRGKYDIVFVDLSSNYREDLASAGLVASDKFFMITTPDIGNLVNTRKYLKCIQMIDENLNYKIWDKVHIVVNKQHDKYCVHEDTVQKTLFNKPVFYTFSEEPQYTYSHNNGFSAYKHHELIRKEIEHVARMIYPFEKREENVQVDITRSKENWVELYGSAHLKNCITLNYNCQRLYVEERAAQEFPDWKLDFDKKMQYVSRACPSPEALEIEMDVRKEKGKSLNLRVVWLKEEKKEVIVMEDYLESYRLIKEID